MHFQVAGVTQPLVSVAGLVDGGNAVVFDKSGGFVHHRASGRRVQLPRVGNTFVLDMTIPRQPEEEGSGGAAGARTDESPAFRRPE